MKSLPPIPKGYVRSYQLCKHTGCGQVYYHDYIPFSLSNPVMWTACGHSIGHPDMNLLEITEAKYMKIKADQARPKARTLEERVLRAVIAWREEELVKHQDDCGCQLCVNLGELADKLVSKRRRKARSEP